MDSIISSWYVIVALVACVAAIVAMAYKFFSLPSDAQLAKVRSWLLLIVIEAEKQFQSGTGRLKLRWVYDRFLVTFPWIAKAMSFEHFSYLVDCALEEMKELIESNPAIAEYVDEK